MVMKSEGRVFPLFSYHFLIAPKDIGDGRIMKDTIVFHINTDNE
jgi:hypothetical protein